jgi:serine/threonine-protein kinase HipA
MNHCRITYEPCGDAAYSPKGLALLSKSLTQLNDLPFSAEEQRRDAVTRMEKMSIQGVQPKLSASLNVRQQGFDVVDTGGTFILKPQNANFPQLPENEAVTMCMAAKAGIEVPTTGLVCSIDGSFTYFIRRFDRLAKGQKLATEDFTQLLGHTRETKYDASMEKLADVLDQFCTFPALEKEKLFRLVLFNFLVGNEDAHLKNFTLITRQNKIELSPAYDLLNSTIVLRRQHIEEFALPLAGKKRKLNRQLLVKYYGKEHLKLSDKTIFKVLTDLQTAIPTWLHLLTVSFLPDDLKEKYHALLLKRIEILGLDKVIGMS